MQNLFLHFVQIKVTLKGRHIQEMELEHGIEGRRLRDATLSLLVAHVLLTQHPIEHTSGSSTSFESSMASPMLLVSVHETSMLCECPKTASALSTPLKSRLTRAAPWGRAGCVCWKWRHLSCDPAKWASITGLELPSFAHQTMITVQGQGQQCNFRETFCFVDRGSTHQFAKYCRSLSELSSAIEVCLCLALEG